MQSGLSPIQSFQADTGASDISFSHQPRSSVASIDAAGWDSLRLSDSHPHHLPVSASIPSHNGSAPHEDQTMSYLFEQYGQSHPYVSNGCGSSLIPNQMLTALFRLAQLFSSFTPSYHTSHREAGEHCYGEHCCIHSVSQPQPHLFPDRNAQVPRDPDRYPPCIHRGGQRLGHDPFQLPPSSLSTSRPSVFEETVDAEWDPMVILESSPLRPVSDTPVFARLSAGPSPPSFPSGPQPPLTTLVAPDGTAFMERRRREGSSGPTSEGAPENESRYSALPHPLAFTTSAAYEECLLSAMEGFSVPGSIHPPNSQRYSRLTDDLSLDLVSLPFYQPLCNTPPPLWLDLDKLSRLPTAPQSSSSRTSEPRSTRSQPFNTTSPLQVDPNSTIPVDPVLVSHVPPPPQPNPQHHVLLPPPSPRLRQSSKEVAPHPSSSSSCVSPGRPTQRPRRSSSPNGPGKAPRLRISRRKTCSHCPVTSKLTRHWTGHCPYNPNRPEPLVCPECGDKIRRKDNLERHKKTKKCRARGMAG